MPDTPLAELNDVQSKLQLADKHGITVDQIDALLEQSSRNEQLSIRNKQILDDLAEMQSGIVDQAEVVKEYVDLTKELSENNDQLQRAAKTKMFNLKKAQVFNPATPDDPYGANQPVEQGGLTGFDQEPVNEPQLAEEQHLHFKDPMSLKQWLDEIAMSNNNPQMVARDGLVENIDNKAETVVDGERKNTWQYIDVLLKEYFPEGVAIGEGDLEANKQLVAGKIFELVRHDQGGIEAPYTTFGSEMYKKIIESSNREIKALAEKAARKLQAKKSFNLSKTAQQKTIDNAFLWGPNEKRFDPFYRQPVSDWHVVERNKGFGLTLDDVWNIDYEAIWRGNIMDKYSRPYRDKDGNWVGGYVQKRFEVDKWIPEANNMQLKPGQRRKPRLPEYGVTEARLQANRAKDDRGYGPNPDTSKPFNWHEASKESNVKTAIGFPSTTTVDGSPETSLQEKVQELEHDLKAVKTKLQYMSPKELETPLSIPDEQELMDQGWSHKELDDLKKEEIIELKEEKDIKKRQDEVRQIRTDPGAFASQDAQAKEASKKKVS